MGWFVRFTLIITRQCLLHIACALIIILIAKLVCVFFCKSIFKVQFEVTSSTYFRINSYS